MTPTTKSLPELSTHLSTLIGEGESGQAGIAANVKTFVGDALDEKFPFTSRAHVQVRRVDYLDPIDAAALVHLLDLYAQDPMGGATPLSADTRQRLCADLAQRPHTASFIAWLDEEAIGLANCFEAYSTFKAQPLLNIHDLAVHPAHRGRGVGQALLAAVEQHAQERGCCKLTLEVLTGNAQAQASYARFGFAGYQLDPAAGHAVVLQKWL